MTKALRALLAAGLALAALPAAAEDGDMQAARAAARPFAIPALLSPAEREQYLLIFADLRASNWASAAGRLDAMRPGALHDLARAMLYTMPGSPPAALPPLMQAAGAGTRAAPSRRPSPAAPPRAAPPACRNSPPQALAGLSGQPRRIRPRPIRGDRAADALEPLVNPLLVADQPREAEAIFAARSADLTAEGRTSLQQRLAWVYFLNGYDSDARRVAAEARQGPTEWALHADWVAGLAAWRMGDCTAAAAHFGTVAARSGDIELAAAGHYWTARADTACGHPERVQARLQTTARYGETFYGLLAQSALGSTARRPILTR